MQDISIYNFNKDINTIREYIRHINLVNNLETVTRDSDVNTFKEFNEHLHGFSKSKKIFEYKSIVISLYGVLEKHIVSWIQEHIATLPNIISNYNDLPDLIYKNHFDLSIKLISLINENRFAKYEHLNKEDILVRLSSCINNPSKYNLNADAFSLLSGNLKHSKIDAAFKPLGIELTTKLKLNTHFSTFLREKYGANITNRGNDLFATIDELVSRRNDIAHGMPIDDIVNITEFNYQIDFLEQYGQAIFAIIIEKEVQYRAEYLYTNIVNIKGIYKKGSVLCFEIENYIIEKGDYIIMETSEKHFIQKEILEIQKNNISYETLVINNKTDIGVNLGGGITKNQSFYLKTKKS